MTQSHTVRTKGSDPVADFRAVAAAIAEVSSKWTREANGPELSRVVNESEFLNAAITDLRCLVDMFALKRLSVRRTRLAAKKRAERVRMSVIRSRLDALQAEIAKRK